MKQRPSKYYYEVCSLAEGSKHAPGAFEAAFTSQDDAKDYRKTLRELGVVARIVRRLLTER